MTLNEKIAQLHGVHDVENYRVVLGNVRLGIPALYITNGPAGVGPGGAGSQKPATAWPAPIALAASWDVDIVHKFGQLAGEETRALGSNLLESPDINIARVPQGGRVFESYGEDPYLVSRLTVANIEGIQSVGVIANVKHYLANNQETNRGSIDEIIAERPLREIYMPGFEAAVKEARVASLMCAYPRVNGAYNCENRPLLSGVLKKDWAFDGFVTSDFGAVHSTVPSALAGLDLELPTGIYFGDALKRAIQSGEVHISRIDDMLLRRFTKMIEFGWWGPQVKEKSIPVLEHGAVSRQMAAESMVLLKNDGGILPLDRTKIKRLALIGPYAVRQMTGGGGSSHVIPFYSIAPVDGIDYALLQQTPIALLDGNDVKAATAAAKRADVAIVMVGDDEGEDHDHGIALPPAQDRLIAAVVKVNPKTIVVLKSGSAVLMPWLDEVPVVLEAWYPGEEDGNAVADVLFGKVNPSGKLPLTFPKSVDDTLARNPEQYPGNGKTVHYSEGLEVGYRAFQANNIAPLFPFGFGLSYTTFAYSDLTIQPASAKHTVKVEFRITNTGSRAGAEVAQLYVTFPPIREGNEPPKQLKGFKKVMLSPGESKVVVLTLNPRAFSYWSENAHAWKIAPGDFQVQIGGSSADAPLSAAIHIQE
jgi:beta-glucosidase